MGTAADGGAGAAARWSLRLLGGFELRALPGGERVALPGRRERVLLAYLALSPHTRRPRSKLTAVLWGDEADSGDSLRTCLWSLRKALGDIEHRVLVSDGEDIVLDVACFDVDALAFQALASRSDLAGLEAAAGRYAGNLLEGLDIHAEEFEEWHRLELSRYEHRAGDVLARLMSAQSEAGDTARAIETGVRLLALDPLNETAARRLMLLYSDDEQRGAAIGVYRALEQALRTELAAEPTPETRAAFAEVARGSNERATRVERPVTRHGDPTEPASHQPATRNWLWPSSAAAAALLVLVIGMSAYRLNAPPKASPTPVQTGAHQLVSTAALAIVVLPCTNLSGDAAQAFFSDGMTEEVTAALVKVPSLRVVARTSAFQFKDQGQDVRTVARSVGASHLVECSVRRDGARVRVTAQLVEAESGTHLWAESYDRDYDDMFAVQDDIAKAIAAALRIPLGLQIDSERIGDLETYQQFLRARAMVHTRGYGSLAEAAGLLEQVVASDPRYAPAWAYLAQAHVFALNYHPAWLSGNFDNLRPVVATSMPKAEAAAQRAVELDANLAEAYAVLGLTRELRGDLTAAEDLYRKALVLDPTSPDVLHFYSRLLAEVGRLTESLAMRQQLQVLDPFVPVYNQVTSWVYWVNGQADRALAIDESLPAFYRGYSSPRLLASVGRYEEAAAFIRTNAPGMFEPGVVEAAADLLRSAPGQVASPEHLPRLGWFNFIYLHVGAPTRTLEFYEGGVEVGYSVSISNFLLWHSSYAALRKTERYKEFMRERGVVKYWRERGWPELCRPADADDFSCD